MPCYEYEGMDVLLWSMENEIPTSTYDTDKGDYITVQVLVLYIIRIGAIFVRLERTSFCINTVEKATAIHVPFGLYTRTRRIN